MNKYFRVLLEMLSRGKVLKRRMRIKDKSTQIFVSPDAQLKYLKFRINSFDRDLICIAENFLTSSSNAWDIGANVGVFTFAAANVANKGTIVSVEPDIWLAQLLRKSSRIKENKEFDIRVLPAAISDQNGVATFMIAKRGRASNALEEAGGHSQMGGVREYQCVPTITLDSLLSSFPAPDFVKIDVEGAEWMVIQGASNIIQNIRPVFYIEIGFDHAEKILQVFQNEDYSAYDGKSGNIIETCTFNTYFIPNENEEARQVLQTL